MSLLPLHHVSERDKILPLDPAVDANQVQELIPRLLLALKAPQNTARDGARAGLLDTPHDHAQVAGLHDDRNTLRLEDLHDGIGNFLSQPLLDLQSTCEQLRDPGQFRDADDRLVGDIANVHLPTGVSYHNTNSKRMYIVLYATK